MNTKIFFKNINQNPECSITVNNETQYYGPVNECTEININYVGPVVLEIAFTNKNPEDTVVNSEGNIIQDKNFELDKILIDGYSFDDLIWDSVYQATNNEVYKSCLFFGPPGKFVIEFDMPFLKWTLKTKHAKNNNDPHWEEDYNYYMQAWNILQQISNK